MKSAIQGEVIGLHSFAYPLDQRSSEKALVTDTATQYHNDDKFSKDRSSAQERRRSAKQMHKLGKKADSVVHGIKEHVRIGAKITVTVKGKLSFGARIFQVGGLEKIFKQLFHVIQGEKLLKASQCYLSTMAGPPAGLLFISTEKIAFCSQKSIKFSSPNGELLRGRYKVVIPVDKIKRVNQSESAKRSSQKYIEIVTVDNFDFWFMGFLSYKNAFKCLQQAVSQA